MQPRIEHKNLRIQIDGLRWNKVVDIVHTIIYGILDCSQSISHCIFYLCYGVFIRPFDQDGYTLWVGTFLNKGVLAFSLESKILSFKQITERNSDRKT